MPLIRPFAALRPAAGRAAEVIAPPYDVVSSDEARTLAADRPWSFLHVSRAEIDLPLGTNPGSPEVYAKAAQTFSSMLAEGVLVRDPKPCYYLYRMTMDGHTQTGLVAAAGVVHYDSNRIRKHEFTRPDKEDDRVRQIEALDAQTGPVLLAYPSAPEIDRMLAKAANEAPEADVISESGIRHTLWAIRDQTLIERLGQQFETLPALYIADGHHRSAAASRVAAARRAANPGHTGTESYNSFLAVVFPHHQMRIMDYNRLVRDLNGLGEEEFLDRIATRFSIEPSEKPFSPGRPGEFGIYLPDRWLRLVIRPDLVPTDPVGRLDVSLLHDQLIAPILGITDSRRDQRIEFVGGIRGLDELERRVDSGEMAIAFTLHPTRMEDLMAVADAGEVMPPKSTWFEPKLVDGLVSLGISG